ncbi:MAG TPA: glycosyltransferase [Solirubrobacterales bacterium]|nr:glycosyltransferase [Solirubrobacterales bacterium]
MVAGGIPLAALRADLDRGWPPGARWIADGGGGAGATLEQPVGGEIGFPLAPGPEPLRLRGRVELAAGGAERATVRLRVERVDPDGATEIVWKGTLRRLWGRALPASLRLDAPLTIPAGGWLALRSEGPAGERLRWRELALAGGGDAPDPVPARAGDEQPARAADGGEGAGERPLFSVLTPVHDPPLEILEETIASVRAQTFADWELCLVDDGSSDPAVREALAAAAEADPRIQVRRRERAGGISAATNAALELARGEYVALLDHDDVLVPEALAEVAAVLCQRPDTDMVYSDEELFGDDRPAHTFAKPHWSPDLLRSQMYTCHLGVYRRELAREVGGFRTEFDGSQDFDFALRVSERSQRVVHIPRVLYRWRAHAGSTAGSAQAKPAAYPAARRAIAEHLERTGVEGDVHFGPWQGIYRVVHRLRAGTGVAVGVVGAESDPGAAELAAAVGDEAAGGVAGATVAFGPDLATLAAELGDADVVVLCEGPVEPLTRLWLARLAGFAQQPGVGAVGARTLAPDGRVERSGIAIAAGLPLPLLYASAAGDPGPLGIGLLPANAAAVAGVVAYPGPALRELGLERELGELASADYCLRAEAAGMRIVSAPDVLLRRVGRPTPANDLAALRRFRERWSGELAADPYFELGAGWPGIDPAAAGSG